MSFGFSISDFALCAQICHGIYSALKEAPRECEIFAQEVLHLHSLLQALSSDIEQVSPQPDGLAPLAGRYPMLNVHKNRCMELLVADIAGQKDFLKSDWRYDDPTVAAYFATGKEASALKRRFSQAKFVRKIPRLREAVASIVRKLTFENVIVIRYENRSATSHNVETCVIS